jgi:uncharacterized protein YjbJ (UPF0337 family)
MEHRQVCLSRLLVIAWLATKMEHSKSLNPIRKCPSPQTENHRNRPMLGHVSPHSRFCDLVVQALHRSSIQLAQKEVRPMNWDQAAGNWKQFKGKVKEQWGKLTDDEVDEIAGKRDQLVGKIQKQYGISKEEAERQVKNWETH